MWTHNRRVKAETFSVWEGAELDGILAAALMAERDDGRDNWRPEAVLSVVLVPAEFAAVEEKP